MPSTTVSATFGTPPRILSSPQVLLQYWHLLSLDAPTVATLWAAFIARSAHLELPRSSLLAIFLAVWILYAADRLLDSRVPAPDLQPRHLFHHRHRRAFSVALVLCALTLAPLLWLLPPQAIRFYLIAGSFLFIWFVLIHVAPTSNPLEPRRLPKELAVGIFFSAAVFIPTVARNPAMRPHLLLPAVFFAALCSLNCLFIYAWEHPSHAPGAHPTTRLALNHLQSLTLTLTVVSLALARTSPLLGPIALAAGLLLVLHHVRPRSRTTLRAAADLALLTPILFLLIQR